MTAHIHTFPASELALCRVHEEWDRAAMNAARAYSCWLFGQELPHWLIAAWENHVLGMRKFGLNDTPVRDVRWSPIWADFVNAYLCHQADWRRAVEVSMQDLDGYREGR